MAKKIERRFLSSEELAILAKVAKNVLFFSTFIWVIHPVHGKVRFNLYPFQKSVLYQFLKERFNIVLKFRQAGLTELISMYCLWLAMYHPNKKIAIISIKDSVARKVLKKIKFMYRNLPWYLQTPIINGRTGELGTGEVIEFSNGSVIESIPTSEQAGRSESLSLLVIDEAAVVRWASTIWASAFPTLSCAIGSTPIITRDENKAIKVVPLETLCPLTKGVQDLTSRRLYTLTHRGRWQQIIFGQNKGELETYHVVDERGYEGGFTPKHRLMTPDGWRTVKDIIDQDLWVIQASTGLDKYQEPPKVELPTKLIQKPLKEYPGYYVTNFGQVYRGTKLLKARSTKDGYLRVALMKPGVYRSKGSDSNRKKHKLFQESVSNLVARTFIGEKPLGYVVDHIDCNRTNNTTTNLRYTTYSHNVKRASQYNQATILNPLSSNRLPDLQLRGSILKGLIEGRPIADMAKEYYPNRSKGTTFIRRIKNERQGRVYISKLRLVKITKEPIYDIHVENDNSYISKNNFINHNTGGSAIINSTPFGTGGWYHSTWVDAITGQSPINPIRLYWDMHPERDQKWYDDMSAVLGPKRTAQEIDGDFLSSGSLVFDMVDIKAIEDSLWDYKPVKERLNGQYKQYKNPEFPDNFYIGADCSTGRNTDYSTFSVQNEAGEEFAAFKGKIPLNKFARFLGEIGKYYGYAKLAPETNDIGMTVTTILQDEGYPNLYYSQKILKKRGRQQPEIEEIPGWLTTSKNRSLIIEGLEKDIREDVLTLKNPYFVQEAYTFIYDASGRPVAMGKHSRKSSVDIDLEGEVYSDDMIFAEAITNHIRKTSNKRTAVALPQ